MAETKQATRPARYKMGNSVLNTYGYAVIGASAIQPLVIDGNFPNAIQNHRPVDRSFFPCPGDLQCSKGRVRMTPFTPLEALLYFICPPLLVMGLWMSYHTWRDDHPRKGEPKR
ncbi:MAG: hypothetical protein ACREHE_12810 [Rhizomicrobium sp.]